MTHDPVDGLAVRLLGDFELRRAGEQLRLPPGMPAQAVKVLAVHAREMHIEELVDALWPDIDVELGRTRLRNVLSRIRDVAGDIVERDGPHLRMHRDVEIDLVQFETEARAAHSTADADAARRHADAAVGLYGGVLLPGDPYEGWAVPARERARQLYLAMLDLLAKAAVDEGRLGHALQLTEQAIGVDRYEEQRYIECARLLERMGRRAAAVHLLQRARAVLVQLEVTPSLELVELDLSLRE